MSDDTKRSFLFFRYCDFFSNRCFHGVCSFGRAWNMVPEEFSFHANDTIAFSFPYQESKFSSKKCCLNNIWPKYGHSKIWSYMALYSTKNSKQPTLGVLHWFINHWARKKRESLKIEYGCLKRSSYACVIWTLLCEVWHVFSWQSMFKKNVWIAYQVHHISLKSS